MLYIREAHPTDGHQNQANLRDDILFEDPKTLAEREKVARDFAAQFKVTLPVLVDTIDNKVNKAYTAKPERIYVIDGEGKIAYKGRPGPFGFEVTEVPPILDKLLGTNLADKAGVKEIPLRVLFKDTTNPGKVMAGWQMRRLKLDEKQRKQVMDLRRKVKQQLEKILTQEQRKKLGSMLPQWND